MKYYNLYQGLGALLMLVAATLKIFHLPHAGTFFICSLVFGSLVQSIHIRHLEKKLKAAGLS